MLFSLISWQYNLYTELFSNRKTIADIIDEETGKVAKTIETCIAGDRSTHAAADDRLKVKIYREHIFGEFNVYTVSNSDFKPSRADLQDGFNQILKQMVSKLNPSFTYVKNDQGGWDLNSNGKFDMIEDFGVNEVPAFNVRYPADIPWRSEAHLMIQTNNELNKSAQNMSHAHFIVHQWIRSHWVLKNNYYKDDTYNSQILFLNSVASINVGYSYRIGEYYSQSDNDEPIEITFVGKDFVKFKKTVAGGGGGALSKNYSKSDNITIYRDGNLKGFCEYDEAPYKIENTVSSSFACDKIDYNLHVHEFLHQKLNNCYPHIFASEKVPYARNIMGPKSAGNELKYRKLAPQSGTDVVSQWSKIGNRTYEE